MRKLNELTTSLLKQTNKPTAKNLTAESNISNMFFPQLIDIICPRMKIKQNDSTISTPENVHHSPCQLLK